MANRILQILLLCSILLVFIIFFLYRGFGWPLGMQGIGAMFVLSTLLVTLGLQVKFSKKKHIRALFFEKDIFIGLIVGLLWTLEIGMNNIIMPALPMRDVYDDVFWVIIAIAILTYSGYCSFQKQKIQIGLLAGLNSGLASGVVACTTALLFIVFGMHQLLTDPLNIAEWTQFGAMSNTPNMGVYFAYQTLAGAIMHVLILGIIMGFMLGIIGGMIGKLFRLMIEHIN